MSTLIPHHALTLVSLWGALEALFSPSTSELRFRVSILIASYIHPPGQQRADMQKEVFDLYDKRSAAAHGKPEHNVDRLMQTFNILQRVLMRMIGEKEVHRATNAETSVFKIDRITSSHSPGNGRPIHGSDRRNLSGNLTGNLT